jgi:O-antigen ligase
VGPRRAQTALLAALAATAPLSVFASELLLALSIVLLVVRAVRRELRLRQTSVDTPLAAFAVWSLLAACFAALPAVAHESAKKLLLFLLFYVALEALGGTEERERVLSAALSGGLALAALMVVQHHFLGYDQLNHRPAGFLGHYMSASGVTMAVLVLAAARLAFSPAQSRPRLRGSWLPALLLAGVAAVAFLSASGQRTAATRLFVLGVALLAAGLTLGRRETAAAAETWLPLLVVPTAAWALVVSQTRGVWVGALVGLAVVAVLRAPRSLALVGAVVVVLLVARPQGLSGRLTVSDTSSVDRYYMWQAGIDMVLDRPVFGQGPGMILATYPRYRWPEAPNPLAPHLHNNALQVAAERGIPGLFFFLWWAGAVTLAAWREARLSRAVGGPASAAAAGVLGVLAAVFVAGLVEYNLGDSEVLMLVLLLTAVPFALARSRAAGAPA